MTVTSVARAAGAFVFAAVLLVGCSSQRSDDVESTTVSESSEAPASAGPAETTTPAEPVGPRVEAALAESFGVGSLDEACGLDSSSWVCLISEIRDGGPAGSVEVLMSTQDLAETPERVAQNIAQLTCGSVPELGWVIVMDLQGVTQGQYQASSSPIC